MYASCRQIIFGCCLATIISCLALSGCRPDEVKLPSKDSKVLKPASLHIDDTSPEEISPRPYAARPSGTLSFTKDISSIILQKCARCHHPGEIAPFSLLSYTDVKKRAKQLAEVTQKRIMPPWAPLPEYCVFEPDGGLDSDQVGMISQWVDEGAIEGDPSELSLVPEFPSGWKYGEPELVVTMPEPFEISADTNDVFRKFVIPVPVEETKYVRAFDFDPGNRSVIHHMRLKVDESSMSRSQDQLDPLPGFDGAMITGDWEPDGFFLGWAPGTEPVPKRADVAWAIRKGADLVLELHLKGTGKTESVQSSIALYFRPTPPTESLHRFLLACQTIDIPAGKKEDVYRDQYILPVDVKILTVFPHAHFLATNFNSYAVLPDGKKVWLMRIDDWDFNWQREYTYSQPISLPKGTAIAMRITYDNSADNPRNPHHPPQRVTIGRESNDEMADLSFEVQTASPAEGKLLDADVRRKLYNSLKEKERFLISHGKATSDTHYNLGCMYFQDGDLQQALQHYQESIRLKPDNIFAVNNLGSVYRRLGRSAAAIVQYTRALQINPQDIRAHNNLGVIYMGEGRMEEAIEHFDEALRISPEFAESEENLGLIAAHRGEFKKAAGHFERALKADPNLESSRVNLRRVLKMRAGVN